MHDFKAEIAKEIGDVMWYCAALADDLGYRSAADCRDEHLQVAMLVRLQRYDCRHRR